jgi:hypothetical protein
MTWRWQRPRQLALLRVILRQMLCSEGSHMRLCRCGKLAQLGWMDVRNRKVGGGKIDNTCKRDGKTWWEEDILIRNVRLLSFFGLGPCLEGNSARIYKLFVLLQQDTQPISRRDWEVTRWCQNEIVKLRSCLLISNIRLIFQQKSWPVENYM